MSLLTLPTELRHQIYSYLTPNPKNFPFDDTSVVEISHRPPPTALQRACRFLYDDTTACFYDVTTIHLEFPAMKIINNPRALATLRRISSVLFHMTWYDWRSANFGAHIPESWSFDMAREMDIIRLLNSEAKYLKKLVVSIQGFLLRKKVTRAMREERLAQLEEVKGGVVLVAGLVTLGGDSNEETQMMLEEYVKKLNADRA